MISIHNQCFRVVFSFTKKDATRSDISYHLYTSVASLYRLAPLRVSELMPLRFFMVFLG